MKPRTQWSPDSRRSQIFEEAIQLIGQRGYRGFTLLALAKRCGLSNAGVLHYFPSKDQLLIALLNERDRQDDAVLEASGLRSGFGFREIAPTSMSLDEVGRIMRKVVSRDVQRPDLILLFTVLRAEALDKDHPARTFFDKRATRTLNALATMLEPHIPQPRETARRIIAFAAGLNELWLREGQGFDLLAEWEKGVLLLLPQLAETDWLSDT